MPTPTQSRWRRSGSTTEVDANEGLRHRRSPLASLAPHQPRPARDATRALERGGVAAGQGRVQESARAEESDPARRLVQLAVVARRPEKKREPEQPATRRVLPMELRIGDRLSDETGEWEVVGRPYTTARGKNARVRVQSDGQPAVSELRTWGAHERVAVRRAAVEDRNQ